MGRSSSTSRFTKTKHQVVQTIRRFIADERGQSTAEYVLILFAVVMIAVKFKTTFSEQMTKLLSNLTGKLNEASMEIE